MTDSPVADRMTVEHARRVGRQRLHAASDTWALDADLLLQQATGYSRTELVTRSDEPLPAKIAERYLGLLERRAAGEPAAYILGTKAFRAIELCVDRRVLVPRPETELLVDVGLQALDLLPGRRRVIDVGTGSGAVALALASEIGPKRSDEVGVVSSDISHEALQVAMLNRQRLGLEERVALVEADLLDGVVGSFDLILANLPYLRENQRHPTTAAEPELALYAGPDGLDLYRRLLPKTASRLNPGGLIACEIDPSQAGPMRRLLDDTPGGATGVLHDLAGLERIVIAGDIDIVRTVADTWRYGA